MRNLFFFFSWGALFSFLKVFTTFGILFYFTIDHLHQPLPFSDNFFSDNNVSNYSKEEAEVSSEGNEDSGRDFCIQLNQ